MKAQQDTIDARASAQAVSAGLIGRGIGQSLSPRMHMAEGQRLGIDYDYALFDFDRLGLDDSELPGLIEKLRAEGFSGVNITHPFKEKVTVCLEELSEDAATIGAVNTVVFAGNRAVGYNTDCWGFARSMSAGLDDPRLDAVVLLGAGGAGLAVGRALLDLGATKVRIFDTDTEKASRAAARLGAGAGRVELVGDLPAALADATGLVNATPVGMDKYPGMPVNADLLRPAIWVADIVYFPAETELLRVARALGCPVLPGAGMAIFQAVRAFELITGVEPDAEAMAVHFRGS